MAVIRQANLLGQQRLDVPHVRAIESAVAGDFDVLAGQMLSGEQAVILNGFRLSTSTAGGAATDLKLQVAGGMMMHFNASESGTVFSVPADRADEELTSTNVKVIGSFTANQTNYIGIDFRRAADSSTADLVQFIDPTTGKETSATVPLARTLDYRIYISTTNFDQTLNICPVAKVVTDPSNNVLSIADARQMMFRLGSGGTSPSASYVYPWAQGRNETTAVDGWSGGDKAIGSLKEWQDAVMTRLWELGGGEYWYANAADRNVNMIGSGTTFSNGEYFVWTLGSSNLVWKGLRFLFDNSAANYNVVQDNDTTGVTLADGECLYVDLDRTTNRTTSATGIIPVKGTLATLGTSTIPGNRYVMAWRNGNSVYTRGWRYAVGATFTPATTTSTGVVKLNNTPLLDGSGNPTVVSIMSNGQAEVTATANNSHGIKGTGHGTGPGVYARGGGTNALTVENGIYNHEATTDWATVTRYANANFGPALRMRKSRSATIGTATAVLSGDTLMAILAQGVDSNGSYVTAAQISAEVDGTPGVNDMPGRLVFSTTPDGQLSVIERLRIGNNGGIGITGLLNNNSSRPSIAAATNGNEIRAISTTSAASDDGFLRISAGGGTTTTAKSYIDLSGFSNVADMNQNIVLGTSGVERMRVSNAGNVTLSTPTSGTSLTINTTAAGGALAATGSGSNSIKLTSTGNAATSYPQVIVENFFSAATGGTTGFPVVELRASRGTSGTALVTKSGDTLGGFNTNGQGTSAFLSGTRIEGFAEADFGATATAGLRFATTNAGSQSYRMTIGGAGNVTINAPASGLALDALGSARIGGTATTNYSLLTVVGDMAIQQNQPLLNLVSANGGTRFGYLYHFGASSGDIQLLNQVTGGGIRLGTNSVDRVTLSSAGNVTINAPTSGNALEAAGGVRMSAAGNFTINSGDILYELNANRDKNVTPEQFGAMNSSILLAPAVGNSFGSFLRATAQDGWAVTEVRLPAYAFIGSIRVFLANSDVSTARTVQFQITKIAYDGTVGGTALNVLSATTQTVTVPANTTTGAWTLLTLNSTSANKTMGTTDYLTFRVNFPDAAGIGTAQFKRAVVSYTMGREWPST